MFACATAVFKNTRPVSIYSTADIVYSNRKLVPQAANKCVNIRRSNDSATTDIGFVGGLIDTSAMASFVGSNSAVVLTSYNQANPSNNLTGLGGGPDIITTGTFLGGPKARRISNSGLQSALNSSNTAKYTMFIRVQINDVTTGGVYTLCNHASGPEYASNYPNIWTSVNNYSNGEEVFTISKDGSNRLGRAATLPSAGTWVVYTVAVNLTAPSLRVWYNGTESTGTTYNAGSLGTTMTLGAYPWIWGTDFGSANSSNSAFSDILVFERLLSDTDIATINANIISQVT